MEETRLARLKRLAEPLSHLFTFQISHGGPEGGVDAIL